MALQILRNFTFLARLVLACVDEGKSVNFARVNVSTLICKVVKVPANPHGYWVSGLRG